MPDQYDPKVSPRPLSDRRMADLRRAAPGTEDDPLAELAKIVQGRPSAASAPAAKAPARAPSSGGLDLEAELMSDLQASFAAVREALPPAAAPSPPRQQPATRAPVMEEMPAFTRPPERSAPLPPPVQPPRNDARAELRDEFRPEPFDETRFVPIPAPPVIQPLIQVSADLPPARPAMERPERPTERRVEEKPAEPPAERAARPPRQPAASDQRADLGAFQMRGSAAASPPPVRQPHSRWEKPEPPRPQAAGASRFAPPRGIAAPPEEDVELDPFAEGGLFADQLDQPDVADAEDEFSLDDLGAMSGYAGDEHLPPFEDDFETLVRRRGPSRNLIIVGAVVAVAVVGGIAFAMLNSGGSGTGTPPVITADGAPTKITPADTTVNDAEGPNKLIYDRVNSGAANNTDTTLLTPGDAPIKDVAPDSTANPISRVIIPGGPGIDQPPADDALRLDQQPGAVAPAASASTADAQVAANNAVAQNDATAPDAIQPIGPRKVRTVVVKPDGTILSSNATDVATDAGTAAPPAAATAAAPVTVPDTQAPPVTDDTAAIAGNKGAALPITAAPEAATSDATATDTATADTQAPVAVETPPVKPAPAATKPAAKTQVAVAETDASPIDLTAGAQPAAAPSGGVLVQISSQRTEDAARATYKDLQTRYPNILGSYDVNIQRADVPDRGTFFRVRVGPFSQTDAQRLCDDLRSAGGDCVLAKR